MIVRDLAVMAAETFECLRCSAERISLLTPRQHEVLLLVAAGRSNEQVAEELIVTTRTVKFHISEIFERLGVDSRMQLGMIALLAHLEPCPCGQ